MALVKGPAGTSLASAFTDELKKRKKKKTKKTKKDKPGKRKAKKAKGRAGSADFTDVCDSSFFAEWLEIRREEKRRKKKAEVGAIEEFPLTQNKKLKSPRRRNPNGTSDGARGERGQQEKKHKKRVVFNLSPVLLEPKPGQDPPAARGILRPERSGGYKKPPLPADAAESQNTSDDINSQDLFITQKTFSDPYIDLCSSTSPEEALEPQSYTETHAEPQACTQPPAKDRVAAGSSPWRRSSPEDQACTAKKQSCPEAPASSSSRKQICPGPQAPTASPRRRRRTAPSPESRTPPCPSYPPPHRHNLDASTQTENFFTSPNPATSLRFRRRTPCAEGPVDLSLPRRPRRGEAAEGRAATPPGDDSDAHSRGRADRTHMKVVQTRLNESFFFRLKGDGDSPKPASPLMMCSGSAEKKKP